MKTAICPDLTKVNRGRFETIGATILFNSTEPSEMLQGVVREFEGNEGNEGQSEDDINLVPAVEIGIQISTK